MNTQSPNLCTKANSKRGGCSIRDLVSWTEMYVMDPRPSWFTIAGQFQTPQKEVDTIHCCIFELLLIWILHFPLYCWVPWLQLMRDDKLTSPLIPIHSASSKLSQAAKCFTLLCYPFQVLWPEKWCHQGMLLSEKEWVITWRWGFSQCNAGMDVYLG